MQDSLLESNHININLLYKSFICLNERLINNQWPDAQDMKHTHDCGPKLKFSFDPRVGFLVPSGM